MFIHDRPAAGMRAHAAFGVPSPGQPRMSGLVSSGQGPELSVRLRVLYLLRVSSLFSFYFGSQV